MNGLRLSATLIGICCVLIGIAQEKQGWPLRRSHSIAESKIVTDGSTAYRFSIVKLSGGKAVHPKTALLENGVPLVRTSSSTRVRAGEPGRFAVTSRSVVFTARDKTDPRTNGRAYVLRLPWTHPAIMPVCLAFGLALMALGIGRSGCSRAWRFLKAQLARLSRGLVSLAQGRWLQGAEIPLSFAMARIATGVAIWLLRPGPGEAKAFFAAADPASYDPVGPFCFVCPDAPSAFLIDACQAVLPVAALCLAAGFLTRISLVVTLLSLWTLASAMWIFGFICHGHTPFVLAALPLLAGRSDAFSIDRLLRKLMGKESPPPAGTRAAVLGMQVMASLVFLSAALHKMFLGNGQFLAWIFSDSLRNLVTSQFFVMRAEMGPWMKWALTHEWAWKALAAGAISCQMLPSFGIFLLRWPWLRLLCGLAVVVEVMSLRIVMGIFPQQFILMAAVFVDWEYFTGWRRRNSDGTPALASSALARSRLVAGLVLFQAVAGVSWFNVRWLYPFTAFPMYSNLFARPPYGEHKPWVIQKSTWHIDSTPPLSKAQDDMLWRKWHEVPWNHAAKPVQAGKDIVAAIQQTLQSSNTPESAAGLRAVDIKAAAYELQAAPSVEIKLRQDASFFQWREDGIRALPWSFKKVSPALVIDYAPYGFKPEELGLAYVAFKDWKIHRLSGSLNPSGGTFSIEGTGDPSIWQVTDGKARIPWPREGGGWLLFVARQADNQEELWAGPHLP